MVVRCLTAAYDSAFGIAMAPATVANGEVAQDKCGLTMCSKRKYQAMSRLSWGRVCSCQVLPKTRLVQIQNHMHQHRRDEAVFRRSSATMRAQQFHNGSSHQFDT